MSQTIVINSVDAMKQCGQALGEDLYAGDLLLLKGDLGAGKTALTQGIGQSLGIVGITSPTFVISRIHHGKESLVHVDAYRLVGEPMAIFDELDLDSHLATSIIVIEWGEGFVDRLADQYLEISIEFGAGESDRVVTLTGHGARWRGFKV